MKARAVAGRNGRGVGGGSCLRGALASLAMLTLGCLSTLATNEIDPGAPSRSY